VRIAPVTATSLSGSTTPWNPRIEWSAGTSPLRRHAGTWERCLTVLTILQESIGFVRPGRSKDLPTDAIWIDLLSPTAEETAFVESGKKVRIPSIEALSEIESSS
jgi:hypothetical protein